MNNRWMINAFKETLDRMEEARVSWEGLEGTTEEHLRGMYDRILEHQEDFSEGKLGRWLGWLQGVLCAQEVLTLEECKQINKRCSEASL